MRKMFSALMLTTIVTAAGPAQAGEGQLDKDLIRRVVRAHLPEIRTCYNEGLARKPELAGKLTVDFTVGPDGHVSGSEIQAGSTVGDATVEACIQSTVLKWLFPKPDGGSVAVSYPFELAPG